MWKRIGVKASNYNDNRDLDISSSRKYKRYFPARQYHSNDQSLSHSCVNMQAEKTLLSEDSLLHLQDRSHNTLNPFFTSNGNSPRQSNDAKKIPILKKRSIFGNTSQRSKTDIANELNENGLKIFGSVTSKRSCNCKENDLTSRQKFDEYKQSRQPKRTYSLKANTDHVAEEIIKLKTQLRAAEESNELYRKVITELKGGFESLTCVVRDEMEKTLAECKASLTDFVANISQQLFLFHSPRQPVQSPSSIDLSVKCILSKDNLRPPALSEVYNESLSKIVDAVENIKSSIQRRSSFNTPRINVIKPREWHRPQPPSHPAVDMSPKRESHHDLPAHDLR